MCASRLSVSCANEAITLMVENVFTSRPELAGTHGMVATTHWLASATGMEIGRAHV